MKTRISIFLVLVLMSNVFLFEYASAAVHPAGTNVSSNGTIYMITDDGQRRPYTSAGAFLSYGFNSWATVVTASSEDMSLPEGSFIPPRDGKIVCSDRGSDKGTCYLITNGKRAAFVSSKVFTSLGFSFSKALYGDVSFLEKDTDITSTTDQHRSGVLINRKGTVYLVSDQGLLGIPSMDVLSTWGYTNQDAVLSNSADDQLVQTSVVSKRSGAKLSPGNVPEESKPSDEALYQSYIDTYPNLPSNTVSAPQDGTMVIDLIKKIEKLPSSDFSVVYPHLTSQSIEMLNKLPELKKYLESPSTYLPGMNEYSTKIDVFEGMTQALYVQTNIQYETSHRRNYYWVCKKENGVWKWDLIGTFKYQNKVSTENNPTDAFTVGSGIDDIRMEEISFTSERYINDPGTRLIIKVKNNGQTTIKKFTVLAYFNNIIVVNETDSYEIAPTQSVYISVPIDYYWKVPNVRMTPGTYTAEARVGLGNATNEIDTSNNSYTYTASFEQKPAPVVPNLIN